MTSIINASVSSNGIVSTADASGILQIQSNGVNTNAQAWVNFNGTTATPSTIRTSYNVSSVTKYSTGVYGINLTNALIDRNWCAVGSAIGSSTGYCGTSGVSGDNSHTPTSSFVPIIVYQFFTGGPGQGVIDLDYINVTVFR